MRKQLSKVSIRFKIAWLAVMCSLLVCVMSITQIASSTRSELKESTSARLTAIREMKSRQIETYFRSLREQIVTFSEDRMIVDAMERFTEAFNAYPDEDSIRSIDRAAQNEDLERYYLEEFIPRLGDNGAKEHKLEFYLPLEQATRMLQHAYISGNPNPTDQKHLLDAAIDASSYAATHSLFHPIIRSYQKRFGYYDIFLVDAQSGHIVYSVFKEIDFATSLIDGPYKNTNMAKVFRDALNSVDPNSVSTADFEDYAPSYNAPASFMASPIFSKGRKIGVLIFQMPVDRVNDIMTDQRGWEDVGLGKSGESYIVSIDSTLRNEPRVLIQDKSAYLEHLAKQGVSQPLVDKIASLNSAIGISKSTSKASQLALRGEKGVIEDANYMGRDTLSAYAPLKIDGLQWAIVSNIETGEAFASIQKLTNQMVLIGALMVVVASVTAFWLASTMTIPLRILHRSANKLREGDFDTPVISDGKDEIGELAQSFEAMRLKLKQSFEEITQRRDELEDRVRERTASLVAARELAEKANAAKGVFLANVSHEIRTPIHAILNMIQLAKGQSSTQKRLDYLDQASDLARVLGIKLDGLVDFVDLHETPLIPSVGKAKLLPLFNLARSYFLSAVESKGLHFELELEPKLHGIYDLDEKLLAQILLGILGNSVKFTHQGGISIKAELIQRLPLPDESESYVDEIEIKFLDTGLGMSNEQASRVFQPFQQDYSNRSREHTGLGIGLTLVKACIKALGGEIEVNSKLGEGTEVKVRLKLRGYKYDVASVFEAPLMKAPIRNVLVVDDVPVNRLIIRAELEAMGIAVVEAENGRASLNVLENTDFEIDLIMMDVQMPIMDGITATRKIRKELQLRTPIVGITADATQQTRRDCLEAGMDEVFFKPVDVSTLIRYEGG